MATGVLQKLNVNKTAAKWLPTNRVKPCPQQLIVDLDNNSRSKTQKGMAQLNTFQR